RRLSDVPPLHVPAGRPVVHRHAATVGWRDPSGRVCPHDAAVIPLQIVTKDLLVALGVADVEVHPSEAAVGDSYGHLAKTDFARINVPIHRLVLVVVASPAGGQFIVRDSALDRRIEMYLYGAR